jgi:hypothetical protein
VADALAMTQSGCAARRPQTICARRRRLGLPRGGKPKRIDFTEQRGKDVGKVEISDW